MAGGQFVSIEIEATINFRIAAMSFSENFLVLPPAKLMMFLQKTRRSILSEIRSSEVFGFNSSNQQNQKNVFQATEKPTLRIPVILSKKYVIPQNKTILLKCFTKSDIKKTIGTVIPNSEFEDNLNVALMFSINEITSDSKL